MAAYAIYFQTEVSDQEAMAEYRSKFGAILAGHGGRIVARDPEFEVLEGGCEGARAVMLEFPDMETLKGWYRSADYKPLLDIRLRAARGNFIVVNGV